MQKELNFTINPSAVEQPVRIRVDRVMKVVQYISMYYLSRKFDDLTVVFDWYKEKNIAIISREIYHLNF